jgi:hypothetical protein
MKAYWGVKVQLRAFLPLAPDGGKWSASRPTRFSRREIAPGTHQIGRWVGPRATLNLSGINTKFRTVAMFVTVDT